MNMRVERPFGGRLGAHPGAPSGLSVTRKSSAAAAFP